jgi:antitoxin FitA
MPSITIRNVPDDAHNELAARAARSGRSLQEFLLGELIGLAERPDTEALAARVTERKRRTGSILGADRILEHLHAERR